jgi:hypothetical protein
MEKAAAPLQQGRVPVEVKTSIYFCPSALSACRCPLGARELRGNDVLALDRRVPHDVEALEDSVFLLTICLPN